MAHKNPRGGGSIKWTTPEQLAYLESQKPLYHSAQLNGGKKFSDFWVSVFENFFVKWPLHELTEEEKGEGMTIEGQAKALRAVSEYMVLILKHVTHSIYLPENPPVV